QALVNPDRMRHYQVTLQDVYQALANNNANSGGGVLPHYAEQYLIRGVGLVKDLDDIRSIVLKEQDGVPVLVRDVAEITIGHEVRYGALLKNGVTESVGGIVMMIRAGNAKEVVSRIKERVAEINEKGMLPDGLKIVPYYDRSELVDAALETVVKVLIEGVFLVIIVLFLFLGDVRSSLVVVASLILTPLITFMVMNHYGLSANLMSLGGLAIATGLIVDGSVVVVENTFQRLAENKDKGVSKVRVVLDAATEVATPVIFGVSIIILVFLPLMTLEGMEGKMFAPLAFTIAIALFVSLVLSLTLTPVLCSYMLVGKDEHDTRLVAMAKKPYLRMLNWSLANGKKTITAASAVFVGAVVLLPFLGTAFIPEMKEGSIVPGINRVPNISLEESIKLEMEAMRLVMQVPGVKSAFSGVGRGESPADSQGQNESTPIVSLKPRDEWPKGWTQDDIAAGIREKLMTLPGVQI
ncbi:MAG: efflux RND transporter permease subunit, partial [Sulfurimicrobium sp.]|nr:efflux RND transporter permease subunit [Sulfurimicrobium sp.]